MNAFVRLLCFSSICLLHSVSHGFESVSAFEENNAKYKVLVFLSRSCPCSRSHVEHLNDLQKINKEVVFFGVITDIFDKDTSLSLTEYYAKKNFNFPLIRDDQQTLIQKYKALKTPHVVLLGRNKDKYTFLYQGGVSSQRRWKESAKPFLKENLIALKNGKPLKYTQGKSLGCYIRRI